MISFCLYAECPDLDDIPNGSVSLSGNTEGSIAKYICNDGFELVGDPTRVCMSDSTWGGEPPTCQSLAGKKSNIL